jgi:hypothetical protein
MGLALGATSAFLLDPQHGRRRRALLRDRVTRTVNESREFADAATRDLRYRAQGIASRARSWRSGAAPDDILVERVRARLGRYSSHPRAIEVAAHESAEGVSSLQGGVEPVGERFELAQGSWSPGVRLLTGGAGALLLLYALSRGGLASIGALAAGAALLGRASANRPLAGLLPRTTEPA